MDQKQRLKLEEHLWILSRLLSTKYDGNTTSRNRGYQLLRYVVATCYPKILLRLNHAVGSRPYLNSLHAVAKIGFKYKRSGHKKIKPGLSGQYLEKEIEEAKLSKRRMRPISIVCLEGANHFVSVILPTWKFILLTDAKVSLGYSRNDADCASC